METPEEQPVEKMEAETLMDKVLGVLVFLSLPLISIAALTTAITILVHPKYPLGVAIPAGFVVAILIFAVIMIFSGGDSCASLAISMIILVLFLLIVPVLREAGRKAKLHVLQQQQMEKKAMQQEPHGNKAR